MVDTRQRLVDASAELFQRQGFNGTSIKQITDSANATTGSLYHFFPGGKDQLAEEVITTSGAGYLAMFQLIAAIPGLAPANAIFMLFDGAAGMLEASDFIDACPIFTVALEVASANDPLRLACQQVFATWTMTATKLFRSCGIKSKRADQLATTVVSALGGAFILARTAKDGDLMRAVGRDVRILIKQASLGSARHLAKQAKTGYRGRRSTELDASTSTHC